MSINVYNAATDTLTKVAGLYGSTPSVPDGKTVTPTNDIEILQQCAGINPAKYDNMTDLLADNDIVTTIIKSNNAIDYMIRSTTFASDICSDQTAMIQLGTNNYASDQLIADDTWVTAVVASTYMESILNGKIPVMTGTTTPSGEVFSSNVTKPVLYFDESLSTAGSFDSVTPLESYVGYRFPKTHKIICAIYKTTPDNNHGWRMQYENGSGTWNTLVDIRANQKALVPEERRSIEARQFRMYMTQYNAYVNITGGYIQLYYRKDV